jgi:hypothetical protein
MDKQTRLKMHSRANCILFTSFLMYRIKSSVILHGLFSKHFQAVFYAIVHFLKGKTKFIYVNGR